MAESLAGRAALVTGSLGGLGRAMAEALAGAGAHVMLSGIETEEDAKPVTRAMAHANGTQVDYHRADLADPREVDALVGAAVSRFGAVDILVNNAVVRHFASIEHFPAERWDAALAVNLSAPFHAIRRLLPAMRARGFGRIVNMASVYGSRGTPNRVDYVVTKAAIDGLTRAVAMEVAGSEVTCHGLRPGSVLTPASDGRVRELMAADGLSRADAERRFLAGKQPSGRFVEAGSVARALLLLCGAAGRDMNGAILSIDGGWQAG